ncbi:nucleotide-binding protein [Candidatus Thorarchaeota archaeon]|nr:MAG: nucleotide-binding protein [Candidatus Thorarchaeota archaeon]
MVPQIVILDTNILTVPAQFGIDIFEETERELETNIDFVILESVMRELERKFKNSSPAEKQKFRIALDLTNRCRIEKKMDSNNKSSVDEQILEFAKLSHGVIATNDKKLIEQAVSQGLPVLFLRGKKRLQLRGIIN